MGPVDSLRTVNQGEKPLHCKGFSGLLQAGETTEKKWSGEQVRAAPVLPGKPHGSEERYVVVTDGTGGGVRDGGQGLGNLRFSVRTGQLFAGQLQATGSGLDEADFSLGHGNHLLAVIVAHQGGKGQ